MTSQVVRGTFKTRAKRYILQFVFIFARVLAIRPDRDPAGKGGIGDRVNPNPLMHVLTDVRPRVDGFLIILGSILGVILEPFGTQSWRLTLQGPPGEPKRGV